MDWVRSNPSVRVSTEAWLRFLRTGWRRRGSEGKMPSIAANMLVRAFVDSEWLPRVWHCHQRPDRSFFVKGRQFHVCARCTGLIAGVVIAPVWVFMPIRLVGAMTAASIGFMLWDYGTQQRGARTSTNRLRLLSGLLVGGLVPSTVILSIAEIFFLG
jgi:uncharacterized membrane protein